jgi:transmembrane sensor
MSDLEERLSAARLEVRTLWSSEKTARLPRKVLLRRRQRFFVRAAASLLCCGTLVGLVFWTTPSAHGPPTLARSEFALSALSPRAFLFGDGSRVSLKSDDAALRTDINRADQVQVKLLAGAAHFDVVPKNTRVFAVECGEVRVTVVGTAFTVQTIGRGARVDVERGRVEVVWREGKRSLGAGEQGVFPPPEQLTKSAATGSATALDAESSGGSKEPSGWRELARERRYDKAYAELFERPAASPPQGPADLLLAADVARLSRHPADAVSPLKKLIHGFSSDSRAPAAAFTLGRVLLEDLGRATEAADAFAQARRFSPTGPLALEALAREITARQRAGQRARAHELARAYLKEYPEGRHASKLRDMLAGP